MTDVPDTDRTQRLRAAIQAFLQERLQTKIEKLAEDDPKRSELIAQFDYETWLENAAVRAKQIQVATHLVKPINPNARGTNIYAAFEQLPRHEEVGSHCLPEHYSADVTGNAGAFDVFGLLSISIDGKTLLELLLDNDASAVSALGNNIDQAQSRAHRFVVIAKPQSTPSSHGLAKQIYWCISGDPTTKNDFHLLAPLFSSPLAQWMYEHIQEDLFGDDNRKAKEAISKQLLHDGVYKRYQGLAIQKLGGTKPQTVSRHNLNRRGSNYLLASLPPLVGETWRPIKTENIDSVFSNQVLLYWGETSKKIAAFRLFLESYDQRNFEKMKIWDKHMHGILDEVVDMACAYQYGLKPGWSTHNKCHLPVEEKLWLDPFRGLEDEIFAHQWLAPWHGERTEAEVEEFRSEWAFMNWPKLMAGRFARFLAAQLEGKYIFDDPAMQQWCKFLLTDERLSGFARQLHKMRKINAEPTYIPTSKTHAELVGSEP